MRMLILVSLLSFSSVVKAEIPTARQSKEEVRTSFDKIESNVYKKALAYIELEIKKASKNGDDVILLNMDDKVYGLMYDKIEDHLKSLGYEVKWNDVGGIPGTSYTMFLQVSW